MDDGLPIPKTGRREFPEQAKRKPLSRAQVIELAQRQSGNAILCGCGCGKPLRPKCVDEHIFPRAALPSDFADALDNRALFLPECAKRKTPKDQGVVAKTRRLQDGRGSQRARREKRGGGSIKGRGLSHPTLKKKFSGEVVPR